MAMLAERTEAGMDEMLGARPARLQGKDKDDGGGTDRGTSVITRTKPKTKRPSLYRVLLLNDDYTPMEFVIHVLERFFQKDHEAATRIMLHVHNHGLHLRSGGDEGHPGHGFRPSAPASAPMRDGKELR